jgi:hypothetical protein
MAYRGSPSHDLLASAFQSGYTPEVRVYLQEILPDGRGGPMMRRLDHWVQVSVKRDHTGASTASIGLANTNDRFFSRSYSRKPRLGSKTDDYFSDVLNRTLKYVNPINPIRQPTKYDPDGNAYTFVTDEDISRYVDFLYDFSGVSVRGEDNTKSDRDFNQTIGPDEPVNRYSKQHHDADLVDLGLMQRVVIDARGPDGEWYAWFTGLVTGIEDTYRAKEVPVVLIQCKDYMRLLQLSEIVLRAGVGADHIATSVELRLQLKESERVTPSTFLADMTGPQILHYVLDLVNQTYAWLPYAMNQLGLGGYQFDNAALKAAGTTVPGKLSREDFWHDYGFWYVPFHRKHPTITPTYLGAAPLRRYVESYHQYGPRSIEGAAQVVTTPGKPSGFLNEFPVAALNSTLLVDANIQSGRQGRAYQIMLENILGLYQIDKTTADQIVRKVADASFYDVFFDGNGNLVYQIPKYNNLPGDYAVEFKSTRRVSPLVSNASELPRSGNYIEVPETNRVKYGDSMQPGGKFEHFDFAPEPDTDQNSSDNFAWRYHGYNYILTDVGVRSWRITSNDEVIMTDVEVPAGFQLNLAYSPTLTAIAMTGRTPLDEVRHLQARFGHRYVKTQQMVLPKEYNGEASIQELLNAFALAVLQQLNGKAVTGQIEMSCRPDLDVGLTVLLLERQHLFYVTGLEHTVRYGKDASTVLHLGYGHDIGTQIPNPWGSLKDFSGLPNVRVAVKDGNKRAAVGGEDAAKRQSVTTAAEDETRQQSFDEASATATIGSASGVPNSSYAYSGVPTQSGVFEDFEVAVYSPPENFASQLAKLEARVNSTPNAKLLAEASTLVTFGETKIEYIARSIDSILIEAANRALELGFDISNFDDVYTLARVIASEASTSKLREQVAVAWTTVYKAGAMSIRKRVTEKNSPRSSASKQFPPLGHYGAQSDGRVVSTRQDPTARHLRIAQAVLNKEIGSPIPPGSHFINPKAQREARALDAVKNRKTKPTSVVVEGWCGNANNQTHGWLLIAGLEPQEFFVLAPAKVKGRNVYGVASIADTIAAAKKYDS